MGNKKLIKAVQQLAAEVRELRFAIQGDVQVDVKSSPRTYSDDIVQEVLLDRDLGYGYKKLARKYGIPKSTIVYWIKTADEDNRR